MTDYNGSPKHALSGGLFAPGASPTINLFGNFTVTIGGRFEGTVRLERSANQGTSWDALDVKDNVSCVFTAPARVNLTEAQADVLYRLNAETLVGDVFFRLEDHANHAN
jgi:hypothetical protein